MNNNETVKYYTFSAGNVLPSWMVEVSAKDSLGRFRSKGKKVVFGTSCVVLRFFSGGYKFMPANNRYTKDGGVFISGVFNSNIDVKGGRFPANNLVHSFGFEKGDL